MKDMKFIRIKVKEMMIESDALIQELAGQSFTLTASVPLPDVYQGKISDVKVTTSNYEQLNQNRFAFNSLSLYNFRIDEATLGQYVGS